MTTWAFRFLLFYIAILYTQPQNRFLFLYPLHIADISIVLAMGLHVLSAAQDGRPLIRFGPGTVTALLLMFFGLLSQYFGPLQSSTAWNSYIDLLFKSVVVLVLVEAMTYTTQRAWAVQATILIASIWWIKGGLRLIAASATYAHDRIMGPAVSMAENPNGFAYMFCVIIPIYFYFFQQYRQKWLRWAFLAMALIAIYIVFETGSRTGMVVLVMAGAFLFVRYFWQYKTALLVSTVVIMMLFSAVGRMNVERFKTIPNSIRAFLSDEKKEPGQMNQSEQSAYERRMKNKHTWELIMKYPILGVGMNPDENRYPGHLWFARGQVHNEPLMAGKQLGLIGIALYYTLLGNLFRHGRRIQKTFAGWWPAATDLGWTFKLQAIVFAVGGFFSPLPWNAPLFILVGAASGLYTATQEAPAPAPVTAPARADDTAPGRASPARA